MNWFRDEPGEDCSGTAQSSSHIFARAPLPWPGTSCVSSPIANRASTNAAAQPYSWASRGAARPLQVSPAQTRVTAASSLQGNQRTPAPTYNVAQGSKTTRPSGTFGASAPHAEKENSPSPELSPLRANTATAKRPTPTKAVSGVQGGAAHTEAALEQPLQQGNSIQTEDTVMREASAAGIVLVPAAKQAPHAAQAWGGEPSIAKQAVSAWGKHAAPEDSDRLLTSFAWKRDQRGQPDSIGHLQSSGVLPCQGPLGAGQEALQRLSYSSDASDASLAHRAQRMEEEAMLYLSHSSSGDSARTGAGAGAILGIRQGDTPIYLSHSSNDSSAHPLMQTVQHGTVPGDVADWGQIAGELLQMPDATAGAHTEQQGLIRSSCISALPWDLGRAKPAVPVVPGHLAVPELMERAGNAAFYDEPELGRTTPSVQRSPSQFAHTGERGSAGCKALPRTPPPPLPAHLKRALAPLAAAAGASAPPCAAPCAQTSGCQGLQSGSETAPAPLAPAHALQAALLQQAARLKPARARTDAEPPWHDPPCGQTLDCRDIQLTAPPALTPPPQGGFQAAIQQQAAKLKPAKAKASASAPQHASPHAEAVSNRKVQSGPPAPPPPPSKGGLQAAKRTPARAAREQEAASEQAVSSGPMAEEPVMDAHQAAMAAIRKGQFKLRSPLHPKEHSRSSTGMEARTASQVQEAAADTPRKQHPAPDAREALMRAIRDRQFSLNSVRKMPEPCADGRADDMHPDVELTPDERKLDCPKGGLHALIRQRTAAMGLRASLSSSSATGWGD